MNRLFFVAALLLISETVLAARPARVEGDDVPMFDGPGIRYTKVALLSKEQPLAVSNTPTQGYYKVRTVQGDVGWVSADSLTLLAPDAFNEPMLTIAENEFENSKNMPQAAAQQEATSHSAEDTLVFSKKDSLAKGANRKPDVFRFRLLGGYSLFSVNEFNSLLNGDVLKNGFHYGGEVAWVLRPAVAVVMRFERIAKSVVGRDLRDLSLYQFDLSSMPLLVGVEFRGSQGKRIDFDFSLMAGFGFFSKVRSTALAYSSNNVTELTDTCFSSMAKFAITWGIADWAGFYVDAGYRYLQTRKLVPLNAQQGGTVFMSAGQYVPLSLNMSGIEASVGLAFNF